MNQFQAVKPVTKFLSLVLGVLLVAAAVACVCFGSVFLAVCCSIVGAYALMIFFDIMKAELVQELRQSKN